MKRSFILLLAISCALVCGFSDAYASEAELPEAVLAALGGAQILSDARWEGADPAWFIAAEKDDNTQVLYCFFRSDGLWTESFHTDRVIAQDLGKAKVHISDVSYDFVLNRTLEGPNLILTQSGAGESDGEERVVCFQRDENGVWKLVSGFSHSGQITMSVEGETATFFVPKDKADSETIGSVRLPFSTDLRDVSAEDLPITVQQALELINGSAG